MSELMFQFVSNNASVKVDLYSGKKDELVVQYLDIMENGECLRIEFINCEEVRRSVIKNNR